MDWETRIAQIFCFRIISDFKIRATFPDCPTFVFVSAFHRATSIEQWSFLNAVGMLGATVVAGLFDHSWPLLIGIGFLGALIAVVRPYWTPQEQFGRANATTTLRTGLLGLLPIFSTQPLVIIGLGLLFLLGDILDGWLARRRAESSSFGAFFDKEADALFVLLLCTIAVLQERLPLWMISVGLLRYVFVVVVFLLNPPDKTEERFQWARYIHGGMVGSLLLVFLPIPNVVRPFAYLAAAALFISFGRSFRQIIHSRSSLRHE